MDKPKPKRFVFDLGDDRRAALEAYRARSGLRSLTEALHRLIDNADQKPGRPVNVADELRAMAVRDNEPGPITKEIQRAILSNAQGDGATPKKTTGLDVQVGPQTRVPGSMLKTQKGKK